MPKSKAKVKISPEELIVERMKKISGSGTAIVAIAKGFSQKDIEDLMGLMNKLDEQITTFQSKEDDQPEASAMQRRKSKAVELFLIDLRNELTSYENSEHRTITLSIDDIMKLVEGDFSTYNNEMMIETHKRILSMESDLSLMHLLLSFSRGKLYYSFKIKSKRFKRDIINTFNISPVQAYRYIRFYLNVLIYKRLLLCGKSFSEIMSYMKDIIKLAKSDTKFNALLIGDIYEVSFNNKLISLQREFNHININAEETAAQIEMEEKEDMDSESDEDPTKKQK